MPARWLGETIGPLRAGRRVLVLCRARATVALVRRWAAAKGGVLGLEATTPAGLAQQVLQPAVLAGTPAPPAGDETTDPRPGAHALPPGDTAIGRRIAGRPGLAALLRRWVQHVRGARAAGRAPVVPAWLDEILATGWGADEAETTLHALVEAAVARGRDLHAGASWDRVVAVGFDVEEAALGPCEPTLVRALAGHAPAPPPEHTAPLPALRVPDVVAEARLAAKLAAADPHGTLCLVADATTARRLRDTLARSGVPCAWRDSEALSVHEVASAVRRAAGWFAEAPDPPIQVADLAFVLARTALGQLHPAARQVLQEALAAKGVTDLPRLGRRGLVEVLEDARLLDAPLSAWLRRLRVLADSPAPRAPVAEAVRVRLLVLRAALEGRALVDVLAEDRGQALAFDPDDFEDALAELLGDRAVGPSLPPGSTLGAVKRFLVDCRVRFGDDPVARAILGALRDRADWPAGPAHVHQALSGVHDPGVLTDGVDVLVAEDWDGRPCRTLLLLDVHDHGLGRRGSPDPLLTDDEIAALGAIAPREAVHHRLRQVRRAAARAARTIAIVTRRDAGGRDVVPPVLLDLAIEDDTTTGSHGLRLDLPELAPLRALEAVIGGAPEPPVHDAWEVRHLATQATAEWYRDGRGPRVAAPVHTVDARGRVPPAVDARGRVRPAVDRPLPLADLLARERPIAPQWVLPYLGHAEGVSEARLPSDQRFSVSRLLEPLSHCPWKAFARVVLGLKEAKEVSEDLDPREVGEVVHQALERTSEALRWRTAGEGEAEAIASALVVATTARFRAAVDAIGALSPARIASVEGRRDRWNTHWPGYVRSRLRALPLREWPRPYQDHPDVLAAEEHVRRAMAATADLPWWMVRAWIVSQARSTGPDRTASPAFLLEIEAGKSRLPDTCGPDVVAVLDHPLLRQAGRVLEDAGRHKRIVQERGVRSCAVAAEIPFGEAEAVPAPVSGIEGGHALALPAAVLRLGSADLELRGRIDRVEWIDGREGAAALVVDYKTGRAEADGSRFRRDLLDLRDPQLFVYAMVLERARREGQLPEPLRPIPVGAVAHDRVLHTLSAQAQPTPEAPDTWLPVEPRLLRWAAAKLGEQVDDARAGRWTLLPRRDTCPRLVSYGHDYCPYAAACRLRGLPG